MTTIIINNGILRAKTKTMTTDADVDLLDFDLDNICESNNALTTETGIDSGGGENDEGETRLETALSVGFTQTVEVGGLPTSINTDTDLDDDDDDDDGTEHTLT